MSIFTGFFYFVPNILSKIVVVISGDKDSCLVLSKRSDYDKKLQSLIDEGIINGTYASTTESTLNDLKKIQYLLSRNFKVKFAQYKDMQLISNQSGRLYGYTLYLQVSFARGNNRRKFKIPTDDFTSWYIRIQCRKGGAYLKPLRQKTKYTIHNLSHLY